MQGTQNGYDSWTVMILRASDNFLIASIYLFHISHLVHFQLTSKYNLVHYI